jgi:hypothetical protein
MADVKRYVGIDVAKAQLEVALGFNGERFAVANEERGISVLLKRLVPADLVIIEAPGGLEVLVASTPVTAGIGWRWLTHAKCATSRAVGGGHQVGVQLPSRAAARARLAQAADGLHPAAGRLDRLADPLTDGVTRLPPPGARPGPSPPHAPRAGPHVIRDN